MSLTKIAIVGATGDLGAKILAALVAEGTFTITVLQRATSTASYPDYQVLVKTLPDPKTSAYPVLLKELLRGQDALIVCYRAHDAEAQIAFGRAAAEAGVKRIIPADFGSVDSSSKRARELVPLFERKVAVRESLQELAEKHPEFGWTSLVTGHFFDWGLREDFLHFDLKAKKADILGTGDVKSSQATLAQVARAVVRILQRPEETKNKMLFVQSFCVSQNEVLRSLEKAMGKTWEVVRYDTMEFIEEKKAVVRSGDATANEDLVFALGVIDGNWEERPDFAMKMLGLKNEDLDEVVQGVVDELAAS